MPRSMDGPQHATDEAHALLRAAEQDWKTVHLLAQHTDAPVASIGFHGQQYLEKVMKGVLVAHGVVFRRTHDLDYLADLLDQEGIELPLTRHQLRRLVPFAVTIRYEDIEISISEVSSVVEMLGEARAWVGRQLDV